MLCSLMTSGHLDLRPAPFLREGPRFARTVGWREPFGRAWRELALRRAAARQAGRHAEALAWAGRVVDDETRWLERLSTPGRASRHGEFERSLSSGAAVLEACAQVVQEYGPAPRGGRLKMLRRLEQHLQEMDAAIKRAHDGRAVRPAAVRALHDQATLALYDLGRGSAARDIRHAVEALDQAAVALAALCVRAALNIRRDGYPGGSGHGPGTALLTQTATVMDEIDEHATRVANRSHNTATTPEVALWLESAVARPRPTRAPHPSTGRTCERRDDLRTAWLELAAPQLLALDMLERTSPLPLFTNTRSLRGAIARRAAHALHNAQLDKQPARFDHRGAYEHQQHDVASAVSAYGHGLAASRVTELKLLGSLARAAAAIWALDYEPHPNKRHTTGQR